MRKTISLQKELTFPTMIGEISSIALDNNLKFINSNKIEGDLVVSGTYKMTEASRITEDFNYSIPTEIELTENLELETAAIDIDDFTYEIIEEDILLCKIDLLVEGVEETDSLEEEIKKEIVEEVPTVEEVSSEEIERACDGGALEEEKEPIELNSLFSNLDDDSFKPYTVYIVRENDTVEGIMEKYNVTKEELLKYNDLDKVSLNTKLIIPTTNTNED
ncbi:MAG: LysM peptidoglycan-binding domain-containing protein [Bacilli bacterium]|nr:LysM peptidoglycan-binding domain-containing protein [Bacilli bacterium]